MQNNKDGFKERLQALFEVSKREYLHGDSLDIGKELSEMLLSKNGLEEFLNALNDLGGESFWENTAVLVAVAKLLTKKPAKVKVREKYSAFIIREFLLLAKQNRWALKFHQLLPIIIKEFHKVSGQSVQFHFLDKLLYPLELFNKGIDHRPNFKFPQNFDYRWNESIWVLSRWINGIPYTDSIICHERLARFLPSFVCIFGHSFSLFKENNSNDELFVKFTNDMETIIIRLLRQLGLQETSLFLISLLSTDEYALKISLQKIPKPLDKAIDNGTNKDKFPHYGLRIVPEIDKEEESQYMHRIIDTKIAIFKAILKITKRLRFLWQLDPDDVLRLQKNIENAFHNSLLPQQESS